MVAVTTTSTRATPRAGSTTTRPISGAAQASAMNSARTRGPPEAVGRLWLKIIAVIRISAILPNSFGSTWKPPGSENQARAPLITDRAG
jgi:hypothetical protein